MPLNTDIHIALGLSLVLAGWLIPRAVAGTLRSPPAAWMLDLAVPGLIASTLYALSGRPLFTGLAALLLGGAYALGDRAKRERLREPVVATDLPQFVQIFRHPRLTLPGGSTGLAMTGAALACLGFTALYVYEHRLGAAQGFWLAIATLGWTVCYAVSRPPLQPRFAAWLRRLRPSGRPDVDARRLGPFATLITYAQLALSERRVPLLACASPACRDLSQTERPHVVMVQCESFFDARRVHPAIPRELLSAYDRCREQAAYAGRLHVPGWGANTIRTEFAALTGLDEQALGFDRFNPYHAYARQPVSSLAWELRARGYRTVCVHPFDRRFFQRHKVMAQLGFDAFIADEAFPQAGQGQHYVTDLELAEYVERLLAEAREPLFVFAITMENHGPWPATDRQNRDDDPAPALPSFASDAEFKCYLRGLRGADLMLDRLEAAMRRHAPDGVLAFYGDHLPSLPQAYACLGYLDDRTDYFILDRAGTHGCRQDLAAHDLPRLILDLADRRRATGCHERA